MDSTAPTQTRTAVSWLATAPADRVDAFQQAYSDAYVELKRLARGQLRRMGRWSETTVLVNEVYLKLCSGNSPAPSEHGHLMALSACAMRQVLVGMARQAHAGKRSGLNVTLDDVHHDAERSADEVLALDRALENLAKLDIRSAQMLELRYFGGYSETETATILGVTDRTLRRDWRRARAFLQTELEG
jgi:RNA polymerase sigma factor (TIGR02999 family)